MNTNKQKKSSFILTIILNLLLITAVIFGITTAYFRDKKSTSGTIKFANGIILDYKGFGTTGDKESGVWNDENSALLNLFNVSGVFPGDSVLINTPNDIKANAESSAFFARYKIDYEFLDINGDKVELSDPSLLITPGAKFNNSTKWAYSTDNYYYYVKEDLTTLESFTNQSDFVSLFADGAYFLIEGDGFIADKNGGFTVEGKNSIMKIKVNLILEVIQDSIDPESVTPIWKVIAPNVQSNIARLSDFDYNVIDSNNDGVTGGEDDYIVLNKYNGPLTNYTVLKHYTVKQENDSFIDATDYDNISVVAVGDKYKLPVKQLGNNETFDNDVKNITIPDSIDKIGNGALKDSTVENVKLKINEGTENEQDIVVFTKDKELAKEASNVISTAPKASEWLKGVYIGYEAFVGTKIKDVVIPEGVEFTINKKAFDDTVGFTYKGTKYNTLEELQEAMKALGDTLTIDSSVLYTPAISGGGVSYSKYYEYDPTGEYSYIDSYGTWSFDLDENNNAIIRTYIPASKYGEVTLDSKGNILTGQISELTLPSQVTNGSTTYIVVGIYSSDYKKGENYIESRPKYNIYDSTTYGSTKRFNGSLTISYTYKKVDSTSYTSSIKGDMFGYIENLIINSKDIDLSSLYTHNLKNIVAENLEELNGHFISYKLETVNMPKLKAILHSAAFYGCTNLKRFNSTTDGVFDLTNVNVIVGSLGINELGGPFQGCTSVEKVYFGQNVYIGARTFKNCSNLTNIYFVSDSNQVNMSTNNITPINIPVSLANNSVSTTDYVDDASIVGYITTEQYKSQIGKDFGYDISSNFGTVTIQGVEGTTVKAGTYNITINLGTGNGYIGKINYIIPTTSGHTTQTITVGSSNSAPTSYTIENFEITGSVYFEITRYYKITKNDVVVDFKPNLTVSYNYSEKDNTLEYYEDQFGNKYYYGTAYYYPNNFDLILTTKTEKAYKVLFSGFDISRKEYKVVEHNNFKFNLPTYYLDLGGVYEEEYLKGKYIAGWTDNNGHTYMFEKRITSDGVVDISSEIVNIQNLTGDITLYPIWKDINYTVTLTNPNKVYLGKITYTYKSIKLPNNHDSSFVYWFDIDNKNTFKDSYFTINDDRKLYNFEYQLEQNKNFEVWANVDNIIGYNGKVYNINNYKWDTGYVSETEGPTTEKTVSGYYFTSYSNRIMYYLPKLPKSRDGYICIGWKNSNGDTYKVGDTIEDLTPTTWTAIWVKIDTGYISDTEGPTTDKNISNYYLGESYTTSYYLPKSPTPRDGYTCIGWKNSNGDTYKVGATIEDLTPTTWTAIWVKIDTGYISDTEGPTTIKTMGITGIYNKSYNLPSEPEANENYYFVCWENTKGDTYGSNARIEDLTPTTWTAKWTHIDIDTGYISDTEGPTTIKTLSITGYNSYSKWYNLPSAPEANKNYYFICWKNSNGDTYGPGASIGDLTPTTWTAKWTHIDIDTGYISDTEGPTTIKTIGITWIDSYSKCYNLPSAPEANKNYYFICWENTKGDTYGSNATIEDLTPTTWTAKWTHIDIDTGYISDTEGPTLSKNYVISNFGFSVGNKKIMFKLPDEPIARDGYVFKYWTNSAGEEYRSGSWINVNYTENYSEKFTAVWVTSDVVTIDTGYISDTEGPTKTKTLEAQLGSSGYNLPSAPEANENYYFMGWENTKGDTYGPGATIYNLTPTVWTAIWVKIDTGYISDTEGPTTIKTIGITWIDSYSKCYKLPSAPEANENYYFIGWENSNGDIYEAGIRINNLTPTTWTAKWTHIDIDTGYISDTEGPTTIKTIGITGIYNKSYNLPSAPKSNEKYYFIGWKNSNGDTYGPGASIGDLTPTTWTAVWLKLDTGYISDTEGPTTTKSFNKIETTYDNNKITSYNLPSYLKVNTGYGFIGWSKDGGNTFVENLTITEIVSASFTAYYINKDEIIIDTGYTSGSGSPTSTQTASVEVGNQNQLYGYCYVSFPTLTANKNYYFVGFKKGDTFIKNYSNIKNNDFKGTWKAIWVKVDTGYVADSTSPTTTESLEITIENKTVDGSLKYSYTIKDNYSYLQNNNGYCLVGWTNDGGNTVVKNVQVEQENFESTTWTAVWKYGKASFNTGYTETDSPTSTQRIDDIYPTLNSNNELVITAPYIETINGYNFIGWRKIGEEKLYKYNETIIIEGNVTFEAVYSKNAYSLIYEVEEGITYTGTLPNDSNNYTEGDEVTLLNPDNVQVEGKIFDRYEMYRYIDGNWNYWGENYPENVISVYHNLKIVLKFRAPYNFTIQFNNTRNNNLNNINGTEGTSVTLPSISDNEQGLYEFIGWEYNGVTIPVNTGYTFTGISYDGETIYLYAKWNYIGTLYNVTVNGAQISSVRYNIGSSYYDSSTLMEGNSVNGILQQDKSINLFISINNGYIIDSIYVNSNKHDRGIEYRFDGNTCIAILYEYGDRYNSDLNFEINFKQVTDEIIEVKLYSNLTNDYSKTGLTTYYAVKGNRLLDKNGSNILANRPNETPSDLTVFAGWFKADGTYIDYNNFKVTENIELYARWGNISVRDKSYNRDRDGIYILTLNSTNLVTIREIFRKGYSYKNGFVIEYNGTQYDIADKDGKFIPNVKASDETIFTDADGKWVYAEIYNIEIYAKEAEEEIYNIIYELDGGTMDTSKTTYTYREDFYLKAPTKEGYTFVGFDYTVIGINKDNMYSKTVEVNGVTYLIWDTNNYNIYNTYGDKTLKAIWTPINYTVKFDVNGGEEIFEDLTTNITNEYKVTIYEQQPTRFGFTFNGWSDGTNVYSAGQQITINPADTTLTAVWVGNDITVSAPSEYSSIFSNLKSGNEITIPNDSDSISGILAFTLTFTVKEGTQEYKLKGGDKLIAPGATNLTVTVNEVEKVTLTIKHNTSETDTNETIITAYQGYTIKELPANIVKDGCLFDVLSSTSTREGTLTTLPMILTTNTTLYVIWKEAGISQTITRDNQLRFDAFWEWLDAIDQTTYDLDSEEYNSKFTFEVFEDGSYIEDEWSNSIGIREAARAINSFTINKNIVTFTAEADGMVIEGKLEIVWESSINRLVYKNWELKTNDGVIMNGLKVKNLTPAENTQDYIMVDLSIINAMSTENHLYNINIVGGEVGGEDKVSVLGGETSAKVTVGGNVVELTHEVAEGQNTPMIGLLGTLGSVNTLCCNYFDYEFESLTVNGNTYTVQVMVENTSLTVTHTIQKSGEDYVMVSTSCPKELIRT